MNSRPTLPEGSVAVLRLHKAQVPIVTSAVPYVSRLKESGLTVLFDVRVQLRVLVAAVLQILFLLVTGSQEPFTARPGPKIRLGADRMKFGSFLQGA